MKAVFRIQSRLSEARVIFDVGTRTASLLIFAACQVLILSAVFRPTLASEAGCDADGECAVSYHADTRTVERAGDVSIAALMPLAEYERSNRTCSKANPYMVMFFLEPFLFVLSRHNFSLNASVDTGRGVVNRSLSLGFRASDQCLFGEEKAQTHALKFMYSLPSHSSGDLGNPLPQCHVHDDTETPDYQHDYMNHRMLGMIGPWLDDNLVSATATVASGKRLVQLATRSTRDIFSCNVSKITACFWENEYLFRAGSSDRYQAYAITDILNYFGWSHIAIVTSENNTNHILRSTLLKHIQLYNICVAFETRLQSHDDALHVDALLRQHIEAKVVVLLAFEPAVKMLIRAISQRSIRLKSSLGRVWVGTDQWGSALEELIHEGGEHVRTMQAVIRLQQKVPSIYTGWSPLRSEHSILHDFEDYMTGISVGDIRRNPSLTSDPLLCQVMEEFFKCTGVCSGNASQASDKPRCKDSQRFTNFLPGPNFHLFEMAEVFTMVATEILVSSLHILFKMFVEKWPHLTGQALAKQFHDFAFGEMLWQAVKNSTLPCSDNETFCNTFVENGTEFYPSYYVLALNMELETGSVVGRWDAKAFDPVSQTFPGELEIDIGRVTFGGMLFARSSDYGNVSIPSYAFIMGSDLIPGSSCTWPCKPGFEWRPLSDDWPKCCRECTACPADQYSQGGSNSHCRSCQPGESPNAAQSGCDVLPKVHPGDVVQTEAAVITLLLMVLNLLTLAVFVHFRKTRLVRSSDFALSVTAIAAIEVGLFSVILHLYLIEEIGCTPTRILALFSLLLTAVIILVKTSRMARIHFMANRFSRSSNRWTMTSAAQSLFIVLILTVAALIEVPLAVHQPTKIIAEHAATKTFKVCSASTLRVVLFDAYFLTIVTLTAVLAFFTRKLPINFKEAQLLFLASFTLCVLWCALRPIYYLSTPHNQELLDLLLVDAHLLTLWVWLFAPRLYALLFRPHRRNRQARATLPGIRGSVSLCEDRVSNVDRRVMISEDFRE